MHVQHYLDASYSEALLFCRTIVSPPPTFRCYRIFIAHLCNRCSIRPLTSQDYWTAARALHEDRPTPQSKRKVADPPPMTSGPFNDMRRSIPKAQCSRPVAHVRSPCLVHAHHAHLEGRRQPQARQTTCPPHFFTAKGHKTASPNRCVRVAMAVRCNDPSFTECALCCSIKLLSISSLFLLSDSTSGNTISLSCHRSGTSSCRRHVRYLM